MWGWGRATCAGQWMEKDYELWSNQLVTAEWVNAVDKEYHGMLGKTQGAKNK